MDPALKDEFLAACLQDVFRIALSHNVTHEITLSSEVTIATDNENVKRFIQTRSLEKDETKLMEATDSTREHILGHCTGLTFTSAYMDERRGSRKKVHSYHEPDNKPSPIGLLMQIIRHNYKAPLTGALVAGSAPGTITTILSSIPQVSSSLGINTTQQGLGWGAGAFLGTVVALYYAIKVSRNPRIEYDRIRPYLGVERVIQDETNLNYFDFKGPSGDFFSGKEVKYVVSPQTKSNTGTIDTTLTLKDWIPNRSGDPLFRVSITDNASKYTVWHISLRVQTGEESAKLDIFRSFIYDTVEIPAEPLIQLLRQSNLQLQLPDKNFTPYSITAHSFEPAASVTRPMLQYVKK